MTDRRSGAQRGWPKGATAQMGLPSKWSGAVWRGRQPEPTPSFTKSRFQFPPLSSRGYPPVAIHCAPRNEPTKPDTRTSRHDGLPRQTIVLLAMTEHVVIARAEPVAIHCEPGSEPHRHYLSSRGHSPVAIHSEPRTESTKPERFTSRHDGLPRPFVPRNDNVVSQNTTDISSPLRVLARAQPVAIHCTPTSEPTNPERNSC